ncbi:MAG: DUF5110 domain-containing protein [Calditrichaceae bacterium]|nr:DUF5110 domain-containing protein [Calditrichaceae bacterium]
MISYKYFFMTCLIYFFSYGQTIQDFIEENDKVEIQMSNGQLKVCPLTDKSVRITFFKDVEAEMPELIFISDIQSPDYQVFENDYNLKVKLKSMIVEINKQSGHISFADRTGKIFLSETPGGRKLESDSVMNEKCFLAEQSFESAQDEFILGLGQFQDGHFNIRQVSRRLTQVNSQISLPFIYSNKGYGLLWHQYGLTDYNPADNFVELEKQEQLVENDQKVEVTTTSGTQKVSQNQSLYTGAFTIPMDGRYSIFLNLGDMDNRHYVVIDDKPCIDQSNFWLPPTAGALVDLKKGQHTVQLVCKSSNTPRLSWKLTEESITFRSPNAKLLDYVVFYGPSADSVIAAYRKLSGTAPMLPRWAYGFWQCRERYTSAAHLVETVKEFRKRNLPMDVIVQDWQYWGSRGWGVPQFDETHYPNPAGFIREIHDLNAHFNISIWSNPDKNSEIGKEYAAKDRFISGTKWLDYFNPATRKEYWHTLKTNMFDYGVDSWWMDAVEPENDALKGTKTYIGPGDFYRLTYPLFVSQSVYEGQRETASDKRVCILTRSAFLGQQRYAVSNWSGDIGGTWDAYKRQIVAGLNYTITGMPYWTTDIGGFFRPGNSQYTDEKYHELLIRWFQWGAFNPIFRMHGYQSETEPWKYGQQVEGNISKMLDLRYRLLPYIYSEAWQITSNGSTMMRPLVMDFREDDNAVEQPYEYMFGKALLVAPITEPGVNKRDLYLPKSAGWYDFWSGERFEGGQTIKTDASLDKIPLFVKNGSIVPMGPFIQYATEKIDPIEIRIYPGADGKFILYEDENDNYNYEHGKYSTIIFSWDNGKRELSIGNREGSFPAMLKERKFKIVKVTKNNGVGIDSAKNYDQIVDYNGDKVIIVL